MVLGHDLLFQVKAANWQTHSESPRLSGPWMSRSTWPPQKANAEPSPELTHRKEAPAPSVSAFPEKRPVRREGWKRTRSRSSHSPTSSRPALLPRLTDYCTVCQRYSHWPRTIISSRRHINSTQVVLKSPSWSFNLYTVSSVHFTAAISVPLTCRSLTCALPGPSSDVKVSFQHSQKKQLKFISHRLPGPIRNEDAVKCTWGNVPTSTAVRDKACCANQWSRPVTSGVVLLLIGSAALYCHLGEMKIPGCVSLRFDCIALIFFISHLRWHVLSLAQSRMSSVGFRGKWWVA